MKNRRNYYRVLQVQPDAPAEVIRASYHALMRQLKQHPDLGGDHWNATILNDAYATLTNAQSRAAYDHQLFARYTKNPIDSNPEGKSPVISYFCPFCNRPLARAKREETTCPSCQSPLSGNDQTGQDDISRRVVARVKKKGTIQYHTDWPQKGLRAAVIHISPRGMRFQSYSRLRTGMTIKISGQGLHAVAVVRNVQKIFVSGRTRFSIGTEFLSVNFAAEKGGFYSSTA
jgi:hypothetical protein